MITIGIDPASNKNLGFAVLEDNKLIDFGTIILTEDIYNDINNNINTLIDKYNPDKLAIESSVGFGFAPTRSKISEVTGIIKFIFALKNIKILTLNAKSTYKNQIGTYKKGQNKKALTIEFVDKLYNIKTNEHSADAILLAMEGGLNVK